jgi:hypothetical protein
MLYAFIWRIQRPTQRFDDYEDTIRTTTNETIEANEELERL